MPGTIVYRGSCGIAEMVQIAEIVQIVQIAENGVYSGKSGALALQMGIVVQASKTVIELYFWRNG